MKALSYRQWLENPNQGKSHPAGLPLSLVRIDNLEYLSTLVIADFNVSFFFQIKNRAGLVLTHQNNPVSLFSNLGQNAKHNLTNWLKTFLHLGLSTPSLSLQPLRVEPFLVFNFSKGVFQDVGNFVQKSGKNRTKQEQNNKKGGADERY